MSLGVLNNLSALYAANNLNNTNNSLSKTLQQLSSGSKINSGADDAAGLSLINGLQANATALSQSQTNSQEGVGLLQVADGALSQVTNLLNRAVTLATEVSNGTLNTAQGQAANQEYQSILSEINNIGSTTTYNQQKVFGNDTTIYTGDSSAQGASTDVLHFATLTSAAVGDANGTVSGNSGGSKVFVDLGTTVSTNQTDNLTAGKTLEFDYLMGDGKSIGKATITTSVANGTASVQGLMGAINAMGLGITATFGTATQAGVAGPPAESGIILTGNVEQGVVPTTQGQYEAVATATPLIDSTNGLAQAATLSTGSAGGGTSTISYTVGANNNVNLNTLGNLAISSAQNILTSLNSAISDVAAQDGYIGSQINTLNAVSSVIGTQQQNVVAAQNAVQATDFAQASSNLSKFMILSQTGISALAQANSLQQEVTKLLQ